MSTTKLQISMENLSNAMDRLQEVLQHKKPNSTEDNNHAY